MFPVIWGRALANINRFMPSFALPKTVTFTAPNVETDNNPYVFKLIILAELLAVSSKTQAISRYYSIRMLF